MKNRQYRLLVVEDDAAFAQQLTDLLESEGYLVAKAHNGQEALAAISNDGYDVALIDLVMPGIDGMEVLKRAAELSPGLPMIVITGHATIDRAVQAVQLGAFDFLEKPVNLERLLLSLTRALEKRFLEKKTRWMADEIMDRYRMVGDSPQMQEVYSCIERVATTDSTVLITGETGTGKDLVAMAIHMRSRRSGAPFVSINCAAIPEGLIESELFGHRRGSFTGASEHQIGKIVAADGGTIFLDEIGDLSLASQSKLLRLLQSNEVEVLGESQPRRVDVRVIAATNKQLREEIKKGLFREDLYYRICVVHIPLPPLRQHREDIPKLAEYFVRHYCEKYNRRLVKIAPKAMQRLLEYDWPGNIRELRSVIERAVVFSSGEWIETISFETEPTSIAAVVGGESLDQAKQRFERQYITQTLMAFGWRIGEAAAALGIDRTNLYKKMQKYHIKPSPEV